MWTPGETIMVAVVVLPMLGGVVVAAVLAAKGNSAGALAALQQMQGQISGMQDRLNAHGQQITSLAQNELPPAVQAAVVQNAIKPPPSQPPTAPLQVLTPSAPATTGMLTPARAVTYSPLPATPPLTQGTPHA